MLCWYLCTCRLEGTWGRCLSAYPHFVGQFPNFSRCKALTITVRVHVGNVLVLYHWELSVHHFKVLTHDLTALQSWSHHLHLEENTDFQSCPCTHIAPLCVLGRCVGSFWGVDFYASAGRQRWNSKELVQSDFLLETGKYGCHLAAPLNSFLQTSLQDFWGKVTGARGSLKGPIHRSPKLSQF